MTHTPYGYKIVNAEGVIDEPNAEKVKRLFSEFVKCGSMRAAAVAAEVDKSHSVVGRILKNEVYLGTDYYPGIIEKKLFEEAQHKRAANAKKQNRIRTYEPKSKTPILVKYKINKIEKKYDDPYKQAEYAYELIEEISDE